MNIEMTMEDYIIILNALHYYKKVEKRGHFKQYDEARINKLRDSLAEQICPSKPVRLSPLKELLD
jgi:hypothetical protein